MQGGHVPVVVDSGVLEVPDVVKADVTGCGVAVIVIDFRVFVHDFLERVAFNGFECSASLFEAAETIPPAYSRLFPQSELGSCQTVSEKGEGEVGPIVGEGTFKGSIGEVVFTQVAVGEGEVGPIAVDGTFKGSIGEEVFAQIAVGEGKVEIEAGEINGFEDVGCGCLEADLFEKGAARGWWEAESCFPLVVDFFPA